MRRPSRLLTLAAAAALGLACGRPAPPAPPEPDPLAYRAPPAWANYYTVADTAVFTVDSGAMGRMVVAAAYAGTARLELVDAEDGLFRATVSFPTFQGSFRAAPDAVQEVDERDIRGEFTVRVGPRGRTDLVAQPFLTEAALEVTGAESLVRPLFVQLPGRPAAPGDVWVDTIVSIEDAGDMRSEVRAVVTSTLVGDTVIGERKFLLVRTRADNRLEMEGRSGGVLVRQELSGTTAGTVVWDDELHMLVARREDGRLTGTLAMPGAGVDALPMAAAVRRTVLLQTAEPEAPPSDADPDPDAPPSPDADPDPGAIPPGS